MTMRPSPACGGSPAPRRSRGRAARAWLCAAALALAAGCSALTDVETDLVEGDDLDNVAGALALRAGAIGAFATAFRIGVTESGQLADELTITNPATRTDVLDTRTPTESNPGSPNAFTTRQDVLEHVATAVRALRRHAPDSAALIGDLFALRGYTLVMLAEHFCSGVPVATFEDGRPVGGVPYTTDELLDLALAAFDTAAALAGESERLEHLAAVGRGRALLNQARYADAAAAVSAVPTSFVREIEYSSSAFALRNQVSTAFPSRTVADAEGGNGLPFASSGDPRLDLRSAGTSGGATSLRPFKYATTDSPIVLADGIEARLIEAEAALQANNVDGWLGILNALRAPLGLAELTDPGTPEARVDLHFAERAYWLFLTAHRLGDLRRLVRQYGRSAEQTFPSGLYKGGPESYGTATHFPVPEAERANPNFSGCQPGV